MHADTSLEVHSAEDATAVFAYERTYELMRQWLLAPEPVACDVATRAGVDVLNSCARCEHD